MVIAWLALPVYVDGRILRRHRRRHLSSMQFSMNGNVLKYLGAIVDEDFSCSEQIGISKSGHNFEALNYVAILIGAYAEEAISDIAS